MPRTQPKPKPIFTIGVELPELDEELADLPDAPETELTAWITKSIRFEPRRSEGAVLAKIEQTVAVASQVLFTKADEAMDHLRSKARDPDGEGLDWDRVRGIDIETAIMVLQDVIWKATPQVAELRGRAVMAHYVREDEYWEAYRKNVAGTIDDHKSTAHRHSKDARYYFFAVWNLWQQVDQKLEAVKQTKRDLEFMRSRLQRDDPKFGQRG